MLNEKTNQSEVTGESQEHVADPEAAVAFDLCERLDKTLVLCPSYRGIEEHTEACLGWIQGFGGRLLHTTRCADVALHRCLLATMAHRDLRMRDETLDGYVLWLDSDVSIDRPELLTLFQDLVALEPGPNEPGRPVPCISARYPTKLGNAIEAQIAPNKPLLQGAQGRVLKPVHCGLGCLLMTTRTFLNHCAHSLQGNLPDCSTIFFVCTSGPAVSGAGLEWHGEDWNYCEMEWHHGAGVYLSSARARHSRQVLAMPEVNARPRGEPVEKVDAAELPTFKAGL
jgi:hypothetical protein